MRISLYVKIYAGVYQLVYLRLVTMFWTLLVRTSIWVRKSVEEIFILKPCSWGRIHFIHPCSHVYYAKVAEHLECGDGQNFCRNHRISESNAYALLTILHKIGVALLSCYLFPPISCQVLEQLPWWLPSFSQHITMWSSHGPSSISYHHFKENCPGINATKHGIPRTAFHMKIT